MIDSHHHFWWTGRHTYHWPEAVGDRFDRDFTPDDMRPELARCGVKGTVLVQVLHQVGGETEECLDLMKDVDFVRGVVGWLPLADPDATSQAIERLRKRGGKLVGVRHLISNEPDPRWLIQDSVVEFAQAARRRRARVRRHPGERRRSSNPCSRWRSACRSSRSC